MAYETLRYEQRDAVAVITLDRPRRLNAINARMVADLDAALSEIEGDPAVRVVIVTGEGRAFSAGADISEMAGLESAVTFSAFIKQIQAVLNRLEALERPVIAAVNGIAYGGGCELALACDLRVAAESASFGVPEIKIGILPGGGGTQRLPRLLPPGIAKQLILTGDPIGAAEAYRLGLVNQVVADERVLAGAETLAATLAQRPPLALALGKRAVDRGLGMDLSAAIEFERHIVSSLFATEDRREGMQAFLEKRPPAFHGR